VNEFLKERVLRRIEALPEERVFQVLDYIEFLESRYATKPVADLTVVQRIAEGVQDTLRTGNIPPAAIAETLGLMQKAMGILDGVKAAAESVASEVSRTVTTAPPSGASGAPGAPGVQGAPGAPGAAGSAPPSPTPPPGS
jgi:hypothetical protein